ncbi:competence/damage-inducible protein A [bacterium]|nr:competence/damage-inducible protein A [bacterium]
MAEPALSGPVSRAQEREAPSPDAARAAASRTAAAIAIGNELLSGKVTDLNLTYIILELRSLGVPLVHASIVPDERKAIVDAIHYASARADVVIVCGGVGPTHDDVTVPAVAAAFGKPLVREPSIERAIRAWYGKHANEAVLRMADVPEGVELLQDDGLFLPILKVEKVHVFPGEPTHFKRKFDAWKGTLRQAPFAIARLFLDVDEGEIARDLEEVEAKHQVAIGSYPKYESEARKVGYRVLVTIESKEAGRVDAAARDLCARLKPGRLLRVEPEKMNPGKGTRG